jgi:glycosyltransferase involved in cell wall biosynthesis
LQASATATVRPLPGNSRERHEFGLDMTSWTPGKILFITNRYSPDVVGGAELSVQTLAEELAARGVSVAVITLGAHSTDTQDTVNGIRVYRLALANLYMPFGAQRSAPVRLMWHVFDTRNTRMAAKVAAILDSERPDWVSTHNLSGFSVAVWDEIKSRGIGLGHVLHDYYLLCPRTTMFKGERNCESQCGTCRRLSAPKLEASRAVDLVIGISRHVLDTHLRRGCFPNARKTVIHNARRWTGASVERLTPNPSAGLRIGYIGRIEPSKGIEVLLRAVAMLPQDRWTLRIAGRASRPEYIEELRQTFARRETASREIEFVGQVKPVEFYPSVDVVVVPSIWNEPLGMVAVESLQFGVPVIVARAGGLPDILGTSGAGWVFEPGDPGELAGILRSLLDDRQPLRDRQSLAAQRRDYFLPARQADEFLAAVSAVRQDAAGLPDSSAANSI